MRNQHSQLNVFGPMLALATQHVEPGQSTENPADSVILLSSVSSEYDDNEQMQLSGAESLSDGAIRTQAASLVIEWAKSGETDYAALEALVVGFVNDDDDDEISDDEQSDIDDLMQAVAQFIADNTKLTVQEIEFMFEEEDDDLAIDAADGIESALKGKNVDEFITDYAAKQNLLLSAVKKVVRDGKVVTIKKRTKKRRMTPAQKAALKKARSKSNNAAARAKRKKSNRIRSKRGLK